jgi:transcription initiation factor TFIIE subunit alpha
MYIVEKAVSIEFDSPEYGRLARKIVEMLLERGEDLTDDRVAILLNISTAETRRILQYLMLLRTGLGWLGRRFRRLYGL